MNPSGEVGLDFRLLGPFEVASNGRLIEIGSPKQRALLAMLLVHRGRVVSFDALAEELWAGHPPASVVTTLSSLVSRLRRLLVAAGSEESGVFLRSEKEGQPHITGYELQIWDYQPAGYNTGSLVGSLKAQPVKIIPDQWHQYEITANGDHFVVVLNGKTVLDGHDPKHPSGVIGFQCQPDNPIAFRNIKIKPILKTQ